MSHVATVNCQITDLAALEQALTKFAGTALKQGQKSFQYYASSKAPCIHAITVPGTKYEVGLRQKSTNPADGFEFACDFYDGGVARTFGPELLHLRNEYQAQVAETWASRRGHRVQRVIDTPQQIQLQVTTR